MSRNANPNDSTGGSRVDSTEHCPVKSTREPPIESLGLAFVFGLFLRLGLGLLFCLHGKRN